MAGVAGLLRVEFEGWERFAFAEGFVWGVVARGGILVVVVLVVVVVGVFGVGFSAVGEEGGFCVGAGVGYGLQLAHCLGWVFTCRVLEGMRLVLGSSGEWVRVRFS